MGKLHFEITADDSSFQRKVQAVEASVKSAQQQIERSGQGIDKAFRDASGNVEKHAGAIEAAFKRAFADAGTMKLSELKSSIKTQVTFLKELEQKYKDVSGAVKNLPFSPKKTEMQGTLKNLKKEIDEEKAALDGLRAKYSEMTSGSVESFRMKLMQITNQLMAMRLAGEQNTQEYKELEKEMGRLATVMREVQQTRMADSTGATQWTGIIQGVQGLMGAYSVGSGIVGMFTKDQETLMQIQTKMQSVMGVLMGMQQISNTLHSTSTFRLRTLKAVTDLWSAANTKAAAGLRLLGVSAGVANVAAKALMATLSLGLSVAIGAVIGLLNKLASKHAEARKKAEESAKAQQEAFEKYADAVSGKSSDVLSKFEALRQKYVKLGDDLKAREKFIADNADAFTELGVQVRNVHEADNLFIDNTEAFKQAVMIRAQALAGEELAAEKYKEAIQKMAEADGMTWRASGTKARYAGLSQEQQKQAQEEYRKAYDEHIKENYTSKLAGKSILERAALNEQKEDIERAAQEAGNVAAQSYIDGLKTKLNDEADELEAEASKLITASWDMGEDARAKLREAGIQEADGKGKGKTTADEQQRAAEKHREMLVTLEQKAQQARIDAMQEGLEKELAQIDHDYALREAEIREQEERLREMQGGMLTETQQGHFADLRTANDKQRGDARFHALAAPVDTSGDALIAQWQAEQEAWNKYLMQYGTFRERLQATKEEYDRKMSEAKTEGERKAAEAELAEILAGYELEMSGFVDGLLGRTSAQLESMLQEAQSQLEAAKKKFVALGSSSTSEARQYQATINKLQAQIKALDAQLGKAKASATDKDWTEAATVFQGIAEGARDAAKNVEVFDSGLAGVLTTVADITSGVGSMCAAIVAIGVAASVAEKASGILAIIAAAVQVVSGLFSIFGGGESSMEKTIREFGELNDELARLKQRAKINSIEDTIFGGDRYGQAAQNMKAYTEAMGRYQATLEKIRNRGVEVSGLFGSWEGFVKSLDKEKANLSLFSKTWETAAESVANMQVQTRHSTWFRSAKYKSLGDMLPNLFNEDGSLNMPALKEFQGNDLYKKLTTDNREMIDDLVENWEQYEEALDEVKSYLSDIFGELGDTMTEALVDAFKNGTDAAQAFTDSVSEMLENLAKDMIYSVTLGPIIEKAQKDMLEIMENGDLTDEQKFKGYTNVIKNLIQGAKSQQGKFNNLMEEYQHIAEANGLSLFGPDERTATAKGIAQASQDSVDELNGRFTTIQGHTYSISENLKEMEELQRTTLPLLQNLSYLATIDENTYYCRRLDGMDTDLRAIKQTLENIELRGISVRP